ncbi:4'-phosphopantetheinyl transferase family protein [Arthrobacter sp. NPDC057388]|uniref:4'-phosphopantetheinyl transferase family protein n=1 Tax=Arthrobacter sp. NPDC057388 TaxID=3346116 RepID=UPI003634F8DE
MERRAEPGLDGILPAAAGLPAAGLAAVQLSAVDLRQAATLDDGEQRLAVSFGSGIRRDRFLAGRIALRGHAAAVAGVRAGALRADFACRECSKDDRVHGMPRYQAGPDGPAVLASLSRTGDWCLLAATADEQVLGVGVDLEDATAAGFAGFPEVALSERERQHLQRMEPALRPEVQTLLWARKEAVLKALGRGLAFIDPSLVDVAGPVPLLPDFAGAPEIGREYRWLVDAVLPDSLGLPGSFVAAVAVRTAAGGRYDTAWKDAHGRPFLP